MAVRFIWPLVAVTFAAASADARPTLRDADLRVTWIDAVQCEAVIALRIDTEAPAVVDHRAIVYAGGRIDLAGVRGEGVEAGAVRTIGTTESIGVRLPRAGAFSYAIAYRASQAEAWAYRCPVWLPIAASDGVSRSVRISVEMPPGATPVGARLPRLAWSGARGEATLGHLPSVVRTPFTRPGEPAGWTSSIDVSRAVDVTAVIALAAVSLLWAVRRR
jgi:hypothetical protein